MAPGSGDYPSQSIEVLPFPEEFEDLFTPPTGLSDTDWPPDQITYLGQYLKILGCRTVVIESHYIDRDYILDVSVFYARNLRNYPNYCRRMHFFSCEITADQWKAIFAATAEAERRRILEEFQRTYLGFTVVKPLPGSPLGRTVLRTYSSVTATGSTRVFGGTRKYEIHLAGFRFAVEGLAFQQQDRGVSACATTALWSSLHKVAFEERILVPTPAQITEAASRYLLAEGRSFPSEGLTIQQVSEAIRGSGLQPMVIRSISWEEDRAQLVAYIKSGFPPVVIIQEIDPQTEGSWHAVCAVGIKMGDSGNLVATDELTHHLRGANAVQALYIHDDRLGPYASAKLFPWTRQEKDGRNEILTGLEISWPNETLKKLSILRALVVPVPDKIRMPISRVLGSGALFAELAGIFFEEFKSRILLNVTYKLGVRYREEALSFGLTEAGIYQLCCETTFPRFLAVVEIGAKEGALFDLLLDTTETSANPHLLYILKRSALPKNYEPALRLLGEEFGASVLI